MSWLSAESFAEEGRRHKGGGARPPARSPMIYREHPTGLRLEAIGAWVDLLGDANPGKKVICVRERRGRLEC